MKKLADVIEPDCDIVVTAGAGRASPRAMRPRAPGDEVVFRTSGPVVCSLSAPPQASQLVPTRRPGAEGLRGPSTTSPPLPAAARIRGDITACPQGGWQGISEG